MKKLITISLIFLTGCTLPFALSKDKTYKAKVEQYRKEAPSGYSFSVRQEYPYELAKIPYKVIQVIGPNEVLACRIKKYITYRWEYGQCRDDNFEHIIFEGSSKRLVDNDLFGVTYYKELQPYSYINTLGSTSTVRSYSVRD